MTVYTEAEETVEERLEWMEKRERLFTERISQFVTEIAALKKGLRDLQAAIQPTSPPEGLGEGGRGR